MFSDVDGRRACFVGDVREYGAFSIVSLFFGYVGPRLSFLSLVLRKRKKRDIYFSLHKSACIDSLTSPALFSLSCF